jgi:hypothetical protein
MSNAVLQPTLVYTTIGKGEFSLALINTIFPVPFMKEGGVYII